MSRSSLLLSTVAPGIAGAALSVATGDGIYFLVGFASGTVLTAAHGSTDDELLAYGAAGLISNFAVGMALHNVVNIGADTLPADAVHNLSEKLSQSNFTQVPALAVGGLVSYAGQKLSGAKESLKSAIKFSGTGHAPLPRMKLDCAVP